MKRQFHSIESLRAERIRLEAVCKEKEAQLTRSLENIQDNFGSIVFRSLLPFNKEQNETVNGILDKVNHYIGKIFPGEDSKVHESLKPILKLVQMIAAGLVYKYVKKFFGK